MSEAQPAVRAPRLRILDHLSGRAIGGALSFEVQSTSHYQADTFRARFSLNADPAYGLDWWGAQQPQILVDIQASLDAGASWTSLIIGQVDHMAADLEPGIIEVDGRDLTAYLIDAEIQETYRNKTAGQVAQILASKHGLTADVTPTTTLVGRYYDEDHERIGLGYGTRTTTEWNLLCSLAQHEQFDVWVAGTILHFHPQVQLEGVAPHAVSWSDSPPTSSAIDLALHRSLVLRSDVAVEVASWNSQQAQRFIGRSGHITAGEPQSVQLYRFVVPNLDNEGALSLAQRLREEVSQHERQVDFVMPGDLTLTPRTPISVRGTGSSFDQLLRTDVVTRSMSFEGGFTMTVRARNHSPVAAAL